jgi:hypothetical protein
MWARLFIVLLFAFCLGVQTISAAGEVIPDVHIAVFRFDPDTDSLIAAYEFSQPFRKSLLIPDYTRSVNIYYQFEFPSDFGWTDVESRLTGERILRATSFWMGTGDFEFPPDSLMFTTIEHGYENPDPDTLVSPGIFFSADVDTAWALVYDTDVINRLSSHGSYEVYAWNHGYSWPGYYELFIIAITRPPAPDDLAILDVVWPRAIITRGITTIPEVLVHNFGDSYNSAIIAATVTGPLGYTYNSRYYLESMPADQSEVVHFDPITVYGSGNRTFDFGFMMPISDAYPENDSWQQIVQTTDQPVFRLDSKAHSTIPSNGLPFDFDGDGDTDIVVIGDSLELWQNDGAGDFADISSGSSLGGRMDPVYAVCADFDGDTHPDLIVSYVHESPQLLAGDGTGVFTDVTATSGLNAVTSYGRLLALDKENDDDVDVIISAPGQEIVIENDGSGYFTDVTATSGIIDNSQTESLTAGDLNNDGFADVVMTHWQDDATVFINDGDGTFTKLERSWAVDFGTDAAMFDFDGDEDEDLLFVQYVYSPSRFYRNNGGLVFEEITSQLGGLPDAVEVDVGDFNEDGWPEVVFSDGSLLMNTGGALEDTSGLIIDLSVVNKVLGFDVHFTDINNDGALDIYGETATYINQGMMPTTVDIDKAAAISHPILLAQNFPNPFNPSTTIRFWIKEAGRVALVVYNVAGQHVRTLVNKDMQAGWKSVTWNGTNSHGNSVSSGVYFYCLKAGGKVLTKKMVLLK